MKKYIIILFVLFLFLSCSTDNNPETTENPDNTGETLYFPPIDSDFWETKSLTEANWNETALQPLLDFLEEKNTKGFIILHNGKIVVEAYMNGHSSSSNWYWASAGKTLTTAVVGIAQDEGLLVINNTVSNYLGLGWTSAPIEKENLITCKHLLSMTSGLDDTTGDDVSPENLFYLADAGTRWAYHPVFVKLQDCIAQATNQSWDSYFNTKLKYKIGMNGNWVAVDNKNVYFSDTRSMARFGLLTLAKGKWENQQIISESFLTEATNTSQAINLAYGYLWWLNGKTSYHLPTTQYEFSGELIPDAPEDLIAALGKNDQKIYVVPSKKLVVIRMGETADSNDSTFGLSSFDNLLWQKINALIN